MDSTATSVINLYFLPVPLNLFTCSPSTPTWARCRSLSGAWLSTSSSSSSFTAWCYSLLLVVSIQILGFTLTKLFFCLISFIRRNIHSLTSFDILFGTNNTFSPGNNYIKIVILYFKMFEQTYFIIWIGLNQLLWYFADLEKRKCYVLPGGLPDWENAGDSCTKWRSFGKWVRGL